MMAHGPSHSLNPAFFLGIAGHAQPAPQASSNSSNCDALSGRGRELGVPRAARAGQDGHKQEGEDQHHGSQPHGSVVVELHCDL